MSFCWGPAVSGGFPPCVSCSLQANVSWAPPSGQAWHSGEGVNEFESWGSWEARVSAPDSREELPVP